MTRIDQPAEAIVAGAVTMALFNAGFAFGAGRWVIAGGLFVVAMVALRRLRVLTDRREQRAFDNGVRAASDAAQEAIRETLRPTGDRRGGMR